MVYSRFGAISDERWHRLLTRILWKRRSLIHDGPIQRLSLKRSFCCLGFSAVLSLLALPKKKNKSAVPQSSKSVSFSLIVAVILSPVISGCWCSVCRCSGCRLNGVCPMFPELNVPWSRCSARIDYNKNKKTKKPARCFRKPIGPGALLFPGPGLDLGLERMVLSQPERTKTE